MSGASVAHVWLALLSVSAMAACAPSETTQPTPMGPLLDGCAPNDFGGYDCALPEGCPAECCQDGVITACPTAYGYECDWPDVQDCGGGRCVHGGEVCPIDGGKDDTDAALDAGCIEAFDCTAQQPCCDDTGDLIYVYATCCGDPGFPSCPVGYDYAQCTPAQLCADSPSPLPDCFDTCGQPAQAICEHRGERDVWECPTPPDAGADCADAG